MHCQLANKIDLLQLTAVCDKNEARLSNAQTEWGCEGFSSADKLLQANVCDAVVLATPHFSHTTIGIAALKQGYHLLVEKPISVHKADATRLIRAYKNPRQIFAAMFNQRTHPGYRLIKQMLDDGRLGSVRRLQWTITDWFRSQQYYNSGGWRATWAGEGGGVLLNQCPHQLDLLHWLFGMPSSVSAICRLGKHHDIEVEDDVTALLDYEGGASGVFTTSTGEAPGINRLEIAAENGLLTYDSQDDHMRWLRNDKTVTRAIAENAGFEKPKFVTEVIPVPDEGGQHEEVLTNFADAILTGAELIAPAQEGLHSVELANAMLLSGARGKRIDLPMSERSYANLLKRRIATSSFEATAGDAPVTDLTDSF